MSDKTDQDFICRPILLRYSIFNYLSFALLFEKTIPWIFMRQGLNDLCM